MMCKRLAVLILALAGLLGAGLTATAAVAGEGIQGEMTWRWEGWRNALDPAPGTDDGYGYGLLRSRLGYRCGLGERGDLNISLQNIRVLQSARRLAAKDSSPFDPNDSIEVNEAWLGLSDFLVRSFTLRAGRFALAYGRERLLGAEERSFYGQHRYDGLRGRYEFGQGWLDLLCLKLVESMTGRFSGYDYGRGDDDARGLYAHFAAGDGLVIEPYLFWYATDRYSGPDAEPPLADDNYFAGGTLFDVRRAGWHGYAEGIYMTGTTHWDAEAGVVAETARYWFGGYAGVEYTFGSPGQPRLGAEFNYASGTTAADAAAGEDRTFISPYGSFSDYLGVMNIVDWSNTASVRLTGSLQPVAGTDVRLDVYFFQLATGGQALQRKPNPWIDLPAGVTVDGAYDRNVGTEFDFFVSHEIAAGIRADGGLGVFSFGDYFGADADYDSILHGWLGAQIGF